MKPKKEHGICELPHLVRTVQKRAPGRNELNCPRLCGQYKKEPLVGKIEF